MIRELILFAMLLWLAPVKLASAKTIEQPKTSEKTTSQLELAIESLVMPAIKAGQMPGCVITFGNSKEIQFSQAYGHRQLQPEIKEMTVETVFDLASLTKPVVTAVSVMLLEQNGRVELDKPLVEYLPEFGKHEKEKITIRNALVHQSGLIADNSIKDYQRGPDEAWQAICDLKLTTPVGNQFRYSDVNFIVLGKLVERISDTKLDIFFAQSIGQPLGLKHTTFNPDDALRKLCAATEKRKRRWIVGQVHDPRAYLLGGVAGHAGLFSTAGDLAKYSQAILQTLQIEDAHHSGSFPLTRENIRRMTAAYAVSKGTRGLGWDKKSPYSSNRGKQLTDSAFGHGGFTGTVLWIDPERDFFFVFLSNRLHPKGKGSVNHLAAEVQDLILKSKE